MTKPNQTKILHQHQKGKKKTKQNTHKKGTTTTKKSIILRVFGVENSDINTWSVVVLTSSAIVELKYL